MPKCLDLQNFFAEYLVSKSECIADKVEDQYRNRLSIYRNNFLLNGEETLAQIFPIVRMLLGASRFFELSKIFVESHLAALPDREAWGNEFPAFLAGSLARQKIECVFDLAQLELYLFQVARASAAQPMRFSDLEGESGMSPRFELIPGLALMKSEVRVDQLYDAHVSGRIDEVEKFEIEKQSCCLVIFQKDRIGAYATAEEEFFEFIQCLQTYGWNETELTKYGANNVIHHLRWCIELGIICDGLKTEGEED
jgi:hypothetical protein